jgi:hypothetical protein
VIAAASFAAELAAGAAERDRDRSGAFPEKAVAALERAGLLAAPAGAQPLPYGDELELLCALGRADAGVARIVDGHFNAVERLRVQAPPALRERELPAIARGELRAGVWGADPLRHEGEPARRHGDVLAGVKTFCSGAGGLQRALVLVRDGDGDDDGAAPAAAWVDLTVPGTVTIDRSWYTGAGMLSSASHRVVFDGAPVLALLGPLTAEPWFARDAVRTAATWAGAAHAAGADALAHLARRPQTSELEALAAGRIQTWRQGLRLWLTWAGEQLGAAPSDPAAVAARLRVAVADAARAILDEAERAVGSRPLATGSVLDRTGRDLRMFLLQHRLEPILARTGRAAIEARR